MKKNICYLLFMVSILMASGCYNDTEENLYGIAVCNLDNLTYSLSVAPIVAANCYACHSISDAPANGSGIVLEGYSNLILAVNNGLLSKSISHEAGASPMPKNAQQLSACKINTIKKWIENGALNN
jgi:hypothetical protein